MAFFSHDPSIMIVTEARQAEIFQLTALVQLVGFRLRPR